MKKVTYSPKFWLEQVDAKDSQPGEEVTLMDWGNVIFDEVARAADGTVQHMTAKLNLDGDFKKTKRKLTWISELSAADVDVAPPAVELVDYDYLITKKKIEEDEEVQNFLTPVTEFVVSSFILHRPLHCLDTIIFDIRSKRSATETWCSWRTARLSNSNARGTTSATVHMTLRLRPSRFV